MVAEGTFFLMTCWPGGVKVSRATFVDLGKAHLFQISNLKLFKVLFSQLLFEKGLAV
jgi:hypothetical protein